MFWSSYDDMGPFHWFTQQHPTHVLFAIIIVPFNPTGCCVNLQFMSHKKLSPFFEISIHLIGVSLRFLVSHNFLNWSLLKLLLLLASPALFIPIMLYNAFFYNILTMIILRILTKWSISQCINSRTHKNSHFLVVFVPVSSFPFSCCLCVCY